MADDEPSKSVLENMRRAMEGAQRFFSQPSADDPNKTLDERLKESAGAGQYWLDRRVQEREERDIAVAADQSERSSGKAVSDHDPPETPTKAARALIGWFAGALAFKCIETIDAGLWPSLGYGAGAVIVAIGDYKLPALLAGSPRLTKTLNGVAGDARWWVAIGMLTLFIGTLSPYVEQRRWPFSTVFHDAAPADAVAKAVEEQMQSIRFQLNGAI